VSEGGGALAGPITWTATDASGNQLHGTLETHGVERPGELALCLALGEWSLDAHAADGAHGHELFVVSRRQAQDEPVVIALAR
jgi:hypothetical protein